MSTGGQGGEGGTTGGESSSRGDAAEGERVDGKTQDGETGTIDGHAPGAPNNDGPATVKEAVEGDAAVEAGAAAESSSSGGGGPASVGIDGEGRSHAQSQPDEKAASPAAPASEAPQSKGGGSGSGRRNKSSGKAVTPTPQPFVNDKSKITLKFLFANRDGLHVTVDCRPEDTVGETKGALLSVWPDDLPDCSGGDRLRLICMGKGILMPDSRTLADCEVPVFDTHATPVNVSVKPEQQGPSSDADKGNKETNTSSGQRNSSSDGGNRTNNTADTGCSCVVM